MTSPDHGSFVREMLAASIRQIESERADDRFELRGWFDGWKIYDRGEVIVTVHGPQFGLAGKILRALREEDLASRSQPEGSPKRSPQPHNLLHKD